MHNLSDADFVLSIPAVTTVQEQLRAIAPPNLPVVWRQHACKVAAKAI
ncbi:hypothetical protein [Nostoc sp.]